MGEWDQEKKAVLDCAKWMSEHGYFGGYRGSGGNISARIGSESSVGGAVYRPTCRRQQAAS